MQTREIKFRGQRADTKEWVYGYYTPFAIHGVKRHFIIPAWGVCFDDVKLKDVLVEVISETVGQYTGLKDMNGVEIYEGDMLRVTMNLMNDRPIIKNCPVAFTGTRFTCEWTKRAPSSLDAFAHHVTFEVIGNLRDNPELIK